MAADEKLTRRIDGEGGVVKEAAGGDVRCLGSADFLALSRELRGVLGAELRATALWLVPNWRA